MDRDLVYLVWTDKNTGNKYKVAELYKEKGTFYFKYILENVKITTNVEFGYWIKSKKCIYGRTDGAYRTHYL